MNPKGREAYEKCDGITFLAEREEPGPVSGWRRTGCETADNPYLSAKESLKKRAFFYYKDKL